MKLNKSFARMANTCYSLHVSDIPALLDLALSIKDFKWAKELNEVLTVMKNSNMTEIKRFY